MGCLSGMMSIVDHKRALLAALALSTLVACGGIADEFLPNTEHGRLEVTVERAVNISRDNVTEFKPNDRLRFQRPMLARTLPPGVEVHVEVYASDFGTYRFGAGWITSGDLYVGRHSVPTEIVEVISSDVRVLTVELVPDPSFPKHYRVKLITLKPGMVRLTFKVSRLNEKRQRIDALIEDWFVLTVSGSPGNKESPMITKPPE